MLIKKRLNIQPYYFEKGKMKYPLYEKAKGMLFEEYENNFKVVKGSPYHEGYMNEKIKHSMQVAGAGNGILAHEPYFLNKDYAFLDVVRTAILLHDIYRFREVRILFETGQRVDHGVLGAEFLSATADFNNILITLPIKHHGHMIGCLYEDKDYQSQNKETKDIIKHIAFAVRDADKIANWHLLANEWANMEEVWLKHPHDYSEEQTKINDELWSWFVKQKVAPNTIHDTNAETLISVLCWLFDMNYNYSIAFCKYHHLFSRLCDILRKMGVDESKVNDIYKIMQDYTLNKFKIEI